MSEFEQQLAMALGQKELLILKLQEENRQLSQELAKLQEQQKEEEE